MSVQIQCEHCGAQFKLKDESKLGKRMKCPKCQTPFTAQPVDDFGDLDEFEEPPLPKPKKKSPAGKKTGNKKGKGKKGKGKKKSSASPVLPLAIGGGVLGLLLVIGIVWLVVSSLGGRDAAEPAVAEAPVDEAADVDEASDEQREADEPDDESAPTGGIQTAYLPPETEFVVQFSPARILNAPLIKPFLEGEEVREFLDEFRNESGFGLGDIESITIGIVASLDSLPIPGPGGFGAEGGEPGRDFQFSADSDAEFTNEPAAPAQADVTGGDEGMEMAGPGDPFGVVTVLRLTHDVQAGNLPFLEPDGESGGQTMYAVRPPTPGGPSSGSNENGEFNPGRGSDPAAEFEGTSSAGGPAADFGMQTGPGMVDMVAGTDMLADLVRVIVPDGKTLVFGTKSQLPSLKRSEAALADRFAFVTEQSGVVLAVSLDFVPALKAEFDQHAAMLPPDVRQSAQELFDMYDKGARGAFLSVDVTEGARLSVGVGGADADAATALRDDVQRWVDAFRNSMEGGLAELPGGLQAIARETVTALNPHLEESVVTVTATVNAGQIQTLQEQAAQLAGQMMMAAMMGGSPFGSFGDGLFPGMAEGPAIQRRTVSGEPQAPASVDGFPEDIELTAVAGWTLPVRPPGSGHVDAMEPFDPREQQRSQRSEFDLDNNDAATPNEAAMRRQNDAMDEAIASETASAMAGGSGEGGPVIAVDLLLGGARGEQVVQFKQVRLHEAVTANGLPLKQRRVTPVPNASPDGWRATESVLVEEAFTEPLSIPLQFDPPAGDASAISALSGEAVLRIANDVQELTLDVASLIGDHSELEAAGIRVLPLADVAVPSVYIGPADEDVAILDVSPVPASPEGLAGSRPGMGSGFGTPAGGSRFDGEGQPGSAVQGFVEGRADAAAMEFDDGNEFGGGGGMGRPQDMGESLAVSRPRHWNPQGFVVALSRSGGVNIRVARGFEEQEVQFTFRDLPVTPPDPSYGSPDHPWVEMVDSGSLPEGITAVFARGTWDPSADERDRRMTFNVAIDVIGPAATRLASAGVFQLDQCLADDGKRLSLNESHPAVEGRLRGLHLRDPHLWGTEMPPDGFRIHFPLSAIEPEFQSLSSLKGSFRFRHAAAREELIVSELGNFVGKRILHDALLDEKVAMTLSLETETEEASPQRANDSPGDDFAQPEETRREPAPGPTLVVSLPSRDRDKVVAVDLLDAVGRIDPSVHKEVETEGNRQVYRFRIGQRSIDQLGLRVVLNRELQAAVRLPFEFENVPVPPIVGTTPP